MANGWITIGTELDTKQFDAQISQLEKDLDQMERAYSTGRKIGFAEDKDDLDKLAVEIEKTKNKLVSLKREKEKVSSSGGMANLTEGFKSVGTSLQNSVKQASRLVLGIFAIRSAYMFLRRSSSELAQYDKQYAANLEYIRFALTQMVAPALQYVVKLAATLLSYINAIAQAWFGVNLFGKASAKDFEKMKKSTDGTKKSVGGVAKAVKDIKKQLAGFDEANILSEDKDTSGGGGGGTARWYWIYCTSIRFKWDSRRSSCLVTMDNRQ